MSNVLPFTLFVPQHFALRFSMEVIRLLQASQ